MSVVEGKDHISLMFATWKLCAISGAEQAQTPVSGEG